MPDFVIDKNVVAVELQAEDDKDVLRKLSKLLYDANYVKGSYAEAVQIREDVFPTGLPTGEYGVAIPHTDAEHVNSPMIAVATLKNPIKFRAMDNPDNRIDIKIVFMLAMKDSKSQLTLLTNLMSVVQDQNMLKAIYDAKDKNLVVEMLNGRINI